MEFDLFNWIILPLLIFCARLIDVSLATLRIIFLTRGKKYLPPLLGFFEILIWILAISQIFKHLNNPVAYVAYAGGFAVGSYLGIIIENRIALGMQVLRIILKNGVDNLINVLTASGFGVTVVDGQGKTGPVKIIFTVIKRKDLPQVLKLLHRDYPNAFFSVEDIRMVEEGIFPRSGQFPNKKIWSRFLAYRKSK
jgi:uncharacterized protein YebE (UPF0316 family)